MNNSSSPPFPFDSDRTEDFVDEKDDCIICGKLLHVHTEADANECYSSLMKRRIFRYELSRNRLEVEN